MLLTLLCLLGLHNISSNGNLRTPGEDEDSGSGFGGTGRLIAPGSGSGLGGTGIRPFLGYETETAPSQNQPISEVRILLHPEAGIMPLASAISMPSDSIAPPMEHPIPRSINIEFNDPLMEGAGGIHITEAIQRDVDVSARTVNSNTIRPSASQPTTSVADNRITTSNTDEANTEAADLSWARLADALKQNPARNTETGDSQESTVETQDRADRPQGIQRPVLPPLQRVRPVQRAGLLPPPIRPLRI